MADKRGFVLDEENFASIKVIGVGGGGCNAVDRMVDSGVMKISILIRCMLIIRCMQSKEKV